MQCFLALGHWHNGFESCTEHGYMSSLSRAVCKIEKNDYLVRHVSIEKIQMLLKSDKNRGLFTWRPVYILFIISRTFLVRMRNILDKSCSENPNANLCKIFFFKLRDVILRNMVVDPGRLQMTIQRTWVAIALRKSTNTLKCVILYLLLFYCNNGCKNAPQCYIYVHCLSSCVFFIVCGYRLITAERIKSLPIKRFRNQQNARNFVTLAWACFENK
jgi:hypothetical protein